VPNAATCCRVAVHASAHYNTRLRGARARLYTVPATAERRRRHAGAGRQEKKNLRRRTLRRLTSGEKRQKLCVHATLPTISSRSATRVSCAHAFRRRYRQHLVAGRSSWRRTFTPHGWRTPHTILFAAACFIITMRDNGRQRRTRATHLASCYPAVWRKKGLLVCRERLWATTTSACLPARALAG